MFRCSLILCLSLFLPACASDGAQKEAAAEGMTFETPGPEHAVLASMCGNFRAHVTMEMAPGEPANESEGIYEARPIGGMWVAGSFKSQFMGQPFEGLSVLGYDARQKCYTSHWYDTMVTAPQTSHGTWDAGKKQMVMHGTAPGMKPDSMREVTSVHDDGSMDFDAYLIGPDGKETLTMHIRYTRI